MAQFLNQETNMRKLVLVSASVLGLMAVPALADTTVVVQPEVDSWIMEQPDAGVTFEGDVVVGGTLPDNVKVIEVPNHDEYAYVVVNKKRVLVERKTHKIVKVY
jgi:hypothetical protein